MQIPYGAIGRDDTVDAAGMSRIYARFMQEWQSLSKLLCVFNGFPIYILPKRRYDEFMIWFPLDLAADISSRSRAELSGNNNNNNNNKKCD
ncbi:hypothetical protein M5K25_001056 [Dendrobium thyrsiflorum]|uniref:Uncharacterized protein n=1 Tax=Dendrobium thyrsiflorum TaxID=117978 RepID=A0ABD0VVH7_DENTH